MVRLSALFALLVGPATAECLSRVPQELRFADGGNMVILAHSAQDVTYRTAMPDGRVTVTTTREGLFPVTVAQAGTILRYNWVQNLPHLAELEPGDAASLQADMVVEQAHTSYFSLDYKVLRAGVVTLGPCAYPVLVVAQTQRLDGRTVAVLTQWISATLRVPLRTEATADGRTFSRQVVTLD